MTPVLKHEQDRKAAPALHLSLVILGLMVTLPFLQPVHHPPIPSFYEEWWAIFLGLLAIVAALTQVPMRIAIPSIALLPIVLLLAVIVQWLADKVVFRESILFYGGYMAWAIAMACLGATLAERIGRARLFGFLAFAVAGGALASAVLAFAQWLKIGLPYQLMFPAIGGNIVANIAQPNLLATYLWIGIAAIVYLRERRGISPVLAYSGVILLGVAAGLSGSRTALLHGCALVLLSLLIPRNSSPYSPHADRRCYLLAALAAVIIVGAVVRSGSGPQAALPVTSAFDRLSAKAISGDGRLDLWRDAVTIIRDHPWIGNGAGNYPWRMVEAAAVAPEGASTYPGAEHAHNLFLQLAADFGMPLLVIVVFLGARWLVRLKRNGGESADEWGIDVMVLLMVHSQLEYPLWNAEYLGLCAVVMGGLDPGRYFAENVRRWVLQFAFVAAALALLPLRLDYGALDAATNLPPNKGPSQEDWRQRIDIVAALTTNSGIAAYANVTLAILLEPDAKPALAAAQSNVCERAMLLWPDPVIITRCAILRQLTGREAEARELLTLVRRAFRDPARRAAIEGTLALSAKKIPRLSASGFH